MVIKNIKKIVVTVFIISGLCFAREASANFTLAKPPYMYFLTSGLTNHWTFDGSDTTWSSATAGTTADIVGGDDATFINMERSTSPSSGKIGQALRLDGVDEHMSTNASLPSGSSFTVALWLRSTDTAENGMIWTQELDGNDISFRYDVSKFSYESEGQPDGNTGFGSTLDNNWHHIVIVDKRSGDVDNNDYYIDGVLVTSDSNVSASNPSNTTFYIGSRSGGANPWKGDLDDIRIYDRELSTAEVEALYKFGSAKIGSSNTDNIVVSDGLVGYWTFDGSDTTWSSATAGTTADVSGNGNTGTIGNMSQTNSPVVGKVGQGLRFDSDNDYVNGGSAAELDDLASLSISLWAKTDGYGENNYGRFIEKSAGFENDGWTFTALSTGGVVRFIVDYDGTNLDVRSATLPSSEFGKWIHWSVTWDGSSSASGVKIYKNGEEVSYSVQIDGVGNRTADDVRDVTIGNNPSRNRTFNGTIDDVRLYNRVLDPSEIKILYNVGVDKIGASPTRALTGGLVGYWTMDGPDTVWTSATEATTADLSGNGNTGTLTNMSRATSPVFGKIGQGLRFDGSDDYLNVGSGASLQLTDVFSYTLWFKTDSVNEQGLIGKYNHNVTNPNYAGHKTVIQTDGRIETAFRLNATNYWIRETTSSYNDGNWHFLSVVYYGDGSAPDIRINGVVPTMTNVAVNNDALSGITDAGGDMYIGGTKDHSTGEPIMYMDGLMDEVRIYNRALSTQEIQTLYNMGR